MADLPPYATYLAFAAALLAVGAGIALLVMQRALGNTAREQRNRLRLAWENSTDMMAVIRVTADGRFVNEDMNAANKAWFRRAMPEISERDWLEHDVEWLLRNRVGYDAAEADAVLATHREVVRTGRPVSVTRQFRTTGEALHRQAVTSPMLDASGRVTHLFYRGTDVTGLRRAEERFRAILDASPAVMTIVTCDDGRYRYVNRMWSQITGVSLEKARTMTTVDAGMWSNDNSRRTNIRRLLEAAGQAKFARSINAADGRTLHLLYSGMAFEYEGEDCILSIGQDVTELTAARAQAEAMTAHFERMFRLIPHPVAIATVAQGRLLEVNDAWLQMYQLQREQAVGQTVGELHIWDDAREREALIARIEAGETVTGYRARFRTPAGLAHTIVSAERISWKGESALIVATLDVTDLQRATEEIRRLNDSLEARVKERTAELVRAVQEMESFSYSVSHDLRAPLRHIAGFTRMLLEDGSISPGSEAARYADRAAVAATRLGTLIDELLDYSRLGRKALAVADTDLARTVASILEDISSGLEKRRVEWDIAPLPRVRADPALIRLVMQNLIENAVKYTGTRDAARIEFGARQEEREDTIWVRDNGVGFDMQHSGKLFGVFQRMHTDAEFEGTGIGLANVKRIVERHGGRIWFEAAPQRGATFYFTLPR